MFLAEKQNYAAPLYVYYLFSLNVYARNVALKLVTTSNDQVNQCFTYLRLTEYKSRNDILGNKPGATFLRSILKYVRMDINASTSSKTKFTGSDFVLKLLETCTKIKMTF